MFDDWGNAIYQNARLSFPAIHEPGSFEQWLSFLLNSRLVERKAGRVVATPKAKDFMRCLVDVGLTTAAKPG